MDKAAALVILFNPDERVSENILSYSNEINRLYIIDNSVKPNEIIISNNLSASKIIFIHDAINQGIANRLNQACDLALNDGFDFLLTMDQDSYFEKNSISEYLECVSSFTNKNQVAMFGINHQTNTNVTNCSFNKVNHLITSGSIINLNNYKKIGDFDENLFIDFVDTDYCFKSILKGYELIGFYNIFMHHEIGVKTKQRSLQNLQSSKRSIHSAVRLYYMVRNFLYINEKYRDKFKVELTLHKKDLQMRIKNKLLYHSNRLQTIKFILKAWKDYKEKRMGKQQ